MNTNPRICSIYKLVDLMRAHGEPCTARQISEWMDCSHNHAMYMLRSELTQKRPFVKVVKLEVSASSRRPQRLWAINDERRSR